MRGPRVAKGLTPLTKAERKRLTRENRRALFPSVVLERYEATVRAAEAKGRTVIEHRAEDVSAKASFLSEGAA